MSGSEFLSGKQIKEVTFNCIQCHIIYKKVFSGYYHYVTWYHYHVTYVVQQYSPSWPMHHCEVTITRQNSKFMLCCQLIRTYTTVQTCAFKIHNWLDLQFQFCVNAGMKRRFHILDNLWNLDIKKEYQETVNCLFVEYHLLVREKKLSTWKDKICNHYGLETSCLFFHLKLKILENQEL